MPPEERDPAHLWDMREASRELADLVTSTTLERFCEERVVRFAVERLLIILGEAASRVSESYQLRHSDIPWRRIQRARNMLAHTYGRATAELVWRTSRDFVVPLSIQLGALVKAPPEDDPNRQL